MHTRNRKSKTEIVGIKGLENHWTDLKTTIKRKVLPVTIESKTDGGRIL
jgi:hypothetical protein